jgi:hypothetical protein
MKQSNYLREMELFFENYMVRRFSFRTLKPRGVYALLARLNHILSMGFAVLGDGCALLYNTDCFECLSPRNIAV